MSISASIDICVYNDTRITPKIIIDILLDNGWTLIHNDSISCLPLGDKDNFNWVNNKNMKKSDFEALVNAKENANEIVGVMLTWKDSFIGGDFLFWGENSSSTFSLNLNASSPIIYFGDLRVPDFNWFLEKLLPPLNGKFGITCFTCEFSR